MAPSCSFVLGPARGEQAGIYLLFGKKSLSKSGRHTTSFSLAGGLMTALCICFFRPGVCQSFFPTDFIADVKTAKFFVVLCTKESCPLAQFLEIV